MPNTIGFQINIGNLPEGWSGDPQDILNAVAELLQVQFDEDIAVFSVGSQQPETINNRAWLREGTAWYVPDGDGGWRSADVDPDYKRVYVRSTDPFVGEDAIPVSERSLWVRTQQTGGTTLARELSVYIDGVWRSLYHAEDLESVTNRLNAITDPDDLSAGLLPNAVSLVNIQEETRELLRKSFLNSAYPIGTLYENAVNPANPSGALSWPESQWVPFGEGRVTIGEGTGTGLTARSVGVELGAETVTLTGAQSGLPSHNHEIFGRTDSGSSNQVEGFGGGGNIAIAGEFDGTKGSLRENATGTALVRDETADAQQAHNNMQPSVVVYRWRRTA